jgi:hypothetical protein
MSKTQKQMSNIWNKYIFKKSTLVSIVMLYLGVFHYDIISKFWRDLFGSEVFINAVAVFIAGYLLRSDK